MAGIAAAAFAVTAGAAHADEPPEGTIAVSADTADTAGSDTTEPGTTVAVSSESVTSTVVTSVEETVECALLASDVGRETARFTVGPEGCEGEVGPISFSAFSLPGGMREPYADQVLIAHHESNGSSYGAGSYELTIDMGTPCNWQTDLYFGVDEMPQFSGLIAYDYSEGNDCGDPAPVEAETCALLTAEVERGTATFTVGPEGCEGEVGPISFSAFSLPGGMREPYEDQVLIAHHEANGSFYGAGSYVLTIDMGTPCNWQTDLYYGVNLMPKFRFLIAYDYDEREVCEEETTTTSTTTTTTLVGSAGGETTTTTSTPTTTTAPTSTSTTTTSSTTTTVPAVGAATSTTTTTMVASAGPTTSVAGQGGTLPSTGPSATALLALLAGILVSAGVLVRRFAHH